MARADAEALRSLLPRAAPAARDQGREGNAARDVFHARRDAFIHFHDEGGVLHADLKKPGGSGFDRFPLATPAEQRKLVDEAKLRARRLDDE